MVTTGRAFFACGAVVGFLAVAAGAFGAHLLRGRLTTEHLNQFELAARYQVYHALALLAAAWAAERFPGRASSASGYAFISGILIFCGSVYALAFGAPGWFGAITPIGGLSFLAGWALLGAAAVTSTRSTGAR